LGAEDGEECRHRNQIAETAAGRSPVRASLYALVRPNAEDGTFDCAISVHILRLTIQRTTEYEERM